jgi:hypothetical protein
MRRRYLEAERSLRFDGPVNSEDCRLRAFLKAEKLAPGKDPKPRMIFPRSPRYNLALASWLKPFEHWLWGYLTFDRVFGGRGIRRNPTRVVAKGLNPRRRANLIKRKFDRFRSCVVFEVDGKAFEAHVTQAQIQGEHSVYLSAYNQDRDLHSLLRRQVFSGSTQGGTKFSRPGGRASGDFNTGMGNSLIMLAVCGGVLQSHGCEFDMLVDGDNALVFLERESLSRVSSTLFDSVLSDSGHEMTLEKPVSYLEGVRFGRSAPVYLGHGLGWTMVRDYRAVLSCAYASHRWLNEPRFGLAWVAGVAQCELSLAVGLPVLQQSALKVLSATEEALVGLRAKQEQTLERALTDYIVVGARRLGRESARPVRLECRISFEKAFGLSPEEQLVMERLPVVVSIPSRREPGPTLSRLDEAKPGWYEPWLDEQL